MTMAEKLVTVAENVPKVYAAGQKSVGMLETVTGNPAVLDYVHSTEHELDVKVTSKNLFNPQSERTLSQGQFVSFDGNELVVRQSNANQWCSVNVTVPDCENLVGRTVTISCDCKVGGVGNNTTVRLMWLNSAGSGAGDYILYTPYVSSTEYQHISISGTIMEQPTADHNLLALMLYTNVSKTVESGEYYAYFKNIQIEPGTTATPYTPYISSLADLDGVLVTRSGSDIEPTYHFAWNDGTVPGVMSASPTTILSADSDSVLVTAKYYLDAASKITDMEQTLLTLGGSL